MIRLDTDTRKLQAVLTGAVATTQPEVLVSYQDTQNGLGSTMATTTQLAALNGATAVDICDAPGRNVWREVDFLELRNSDSAPVTATVRINDNGTIVKQFVATLGVGDVVEYTHALGWRVIDSSGNLKQ